MLTINKANEWSTKRQSLFAILLYLSIALLFTGLVWVHPATRLWGQSWSDHDVFTWILQWWPYAITHRINPFITHSVCFPAAFNIVQMTSIPLIAIIMWPITSLFGAVIANNCVVVLSFSLAAFFAYQLTYALVKHFWPAIIAGFLFGYSGYMTSHVLVGHLNLIASVWIIPASLLLLRQRIQHNITSTTFITLQVALLCTLFLISKEIFVTAAFAYIALTIAGYYWRAQTKAMCLKMAGLIILSYIITLILVSPFIYYFYFFNAGHGVYLSHTALLGNDLLNIVVDKNMLLAQFSNISLVDKDIGEHNAYIGIGCLCAIGLFIMAIKKGPLEKVLLTLFLVFLVLSLGSVLWINGKPTIWLATKIVFDFPVLQHIIPARLFVYASLCVSIIVAIVLSSNIIHQTIKWALVVSILLLHIPSIQYFQSYVDVSTTPAFFKQKLYKHYLPYHTSVRILPYKMAARYLPPNDYLMLAQWYYGPFQPVCRRATYQYSITSESFYKRHQQQLLALGAPRFIAGAAIFKNDPTINKHL